jgi:hypothetical protein
VSLVNPSEGGGPLARLARDALPEKRLPNDWGDSGLFRRYHLVIIEDGRMGRDTEAAPTSDWRLAGCSS